VAENTHLRGENYFYYNCLTGHFLRDNCPAYLTPEGFARLQAPGGIDRLTISSGFFMDELRARTYSKVRLAGRPLTLFDRPLAIL
jgi:betaine lipid synthase